MQQSLFSPPAPVQSLRPYQAEAIDAVEKELTERERTMLVLATGAGKTIVAAELAKRDRNRRVLFIADASELVRQAQDKIGKWCGEDVGVEMASDKAIGFERIIIATTQSMARRLNNWPRDSFDLIIVDEAHRNTLGGMAQAVLTHFRAKVVGITATPYRADRRKLAEFYDSIAYEAGLDVLIPQGFLCPITVQQVPLNIDLRGVGSRAGDYKDEDLDHAITPYLDACADLLLEYAPGRKTVAFLPLIATSKLFSDICAAKGINAVHVDGTDRSELRNDWQVICNSALLTTGWDEPSVDCVLILRPTKSLVLYSQMVGRGTRIHPGKSNLLLLDPLYLTEKHDLVQPARLFAKTDDEAADIQRVITSGGGSADLLAATKDAAQQRHERLVKELEDRKRRKARTIDLLSWSLSVGDDELAQYEPVYKWEMQPVTDKQAAYLQRSGFSMDDVTCKGQASKIIDTLSKRRDMGLCTPKQMRLLSRLGFRNPETATFEEATNYINQRLR